MIKQMGSEKGFTLIEVLVAVALVGLCLIGLLTLLPAGSELMLETNNRQTAVNMATAELEFIKNQPFVTWDYENDVPIGGEYTFMDPVPTEYTGYIPTLAVEPVETDPTKIQLLTVTISQGGEALATISGYKVQW